MALIEANRRLANLVGRSWSPFGRAGPLTGADAYGSGAHWLFWVIGLVGFIAVIVSVLPSAGHLDRSNLYAALLVLGAIALTVDEYRMHCWRIQRLHDIGETSWAAYVRRLPVWLFAFGILGIFAWFLLSAPEPLNAGVETAQQFVLVVLLSVGITLPVIAFVVGSVFYRRILKPFNAHLATTPGEPGPNQYGPPSAS